MKEKSCFEAYSGGFVQRETNSFMSVKYNNYNKCLHAKFWKE